MANRIDIHKNKTRYIKFFVFCFLCSTLFQGQNVFADNYGVLIGVSIYPALPESRWLKGPKNDIQMMAEILRNRNFPKQNLIVLADGIPNADLPTRNAILAALEKIKNKVKKGDFVYLHFSGHGSQQPQADFATSKEADLLDEIILPYDAAKWNPETRTVENSISDNEIHTAITLIREKGAFVWAVFDCCHSGTMIRGAPAGKIKFRKIEPDILGIPPGLIKKDKGVKKTVKPTPKPQLPGGYVAFYASHPRELAPEMSMSQGKEAAKPFGLFSYTIATLMVDGHPVSYRQAAQGILAQYFAYNIKSPTPMFEGSHLDAPIFGDENSTPVRQWPIVVRPSALFIPVGPLLQIGDGSIFAIVRNASDKDTDAIGYAIAKNVSTDRMELAPIAYNGIPKPSEQDISCKCFARLIVPKVYFTLTVALPILPEHASELVFAAEKAIWKISEHATEKSILIKWVTHGEAAGIRLAFTPAALKDLPQNRLWFLSRNSTFNESKGTLPLSVCIDKSENELSLMLHDTLQRMGKVINLVRLSDSIAGNGKAPALKLTLYVRRAGEARESIVQPEERPTFHQGDHLRLQACNTGRKPIDLTVLFVDSRFGIDSLFPAQGETNCIEPGSTKTDVIDADINIQTTGTEQLIAIAVVAPPNTISADFSFLAQPGLPRIRTVDQQPCVCIECSTSDMFVQAGFITENHRGRSSRMRASIMMYAWYVKK